MDRVKICTLLVTTILSFLIAAPGRAGSLPSSNKASTQPAGSPADRQALEVLAAMGEELNRSLAKLKNAGKAPVYYLGYRLYDCNSDSISASNGALSELPAGVDSRMLSVDLRVGSHHFDNTHFLRGEDSDPPTFWEKSDVLDSILPGSGGGLPLRQCLWLTTDQAFRAAELRYSELSVTNEVMSAEDDKSDDFSIQPMHHYMSALKDVHLDRALWTDRARRLSQLFLKYPILQSSDVSLAAKRTTRYMVNSEGSRLVEQQFSYRLMMQASTLAKDGMQLSLWDAIETVDPALLPDEAALARRAERLAANLEQLRQAPVAEPFVGPAILSGQAAAVFFHETFGHRIEAVHEKSEREGKTFSCRIGSVVMPKFLSVIDDPTIVKVNGEYLCGHYTFDDEGVAAQPVTLAKNGVLKSFLLSRALVRGFSASNGHGRSCPGWNPVARQANLFVIADKEKEVSSKTLRAMLVKEAARQRKSYGLLFDQIEGGFTYTNNDSAQTYVVQPLRVFKVFVDGRPDQLIRGAEIVGTPLAALERVIAAGNDRVVFNGVCDRESGPLPVSAVAPSLLIQSIETKRKAKTFEKLPILCDPTLQPRSTGQSSAYSESTTKR